MFEWDPRKAAANADRHGVTFEATATVFADPDALDGPDLTHSAVEARAPSGTRRRWAGVDGG